MFPEWGVAVLAGLVLAIIVPTFKFTTKAIARAIVEEIRVSLDIESMREDLAYVKNELTINGGETVKDRIHSIEKQVEMLIVDG